MTARSPDARFEMQLVAIFTLVAIIALCAVVLGVGLLLTAPAPSIVGAPPIDLDAEPVEFESASGATIRGWFIAGQPGGGAVILLHGVRSNRLQMVARARLLRSAGFSILLFDFQTHGESTGARITYGHLEGRDTAAAVDLVRRRLPGEKIGIIGSSLGGAAALLAPIRLAVDALVLEAVYPDIGTATANRVSVVLGAQLGAIVSKPLARLFALLMSPILRVTTADLRPIDRVAEIGAPVLMLVGTGDSRTTVAETGMMFARAREPKFLWLVEGAGHVDLEAFAPDEYRQRVLPFLLERLRR